LSDAPFTAAQGWRYGLLGLPLAFVALPLHVLLPNHYAREFGVSLAALGALLLASRLLDAFLDPWLGRVVDRLFARSATAVLRLGAASAAGLALGFALLFSPPRLDAQALLAWAAFALALTYAAFSALTIAHQAWGAMLGGDPVQRSRVVAWREAFGLAGVLCASALPLLAGYPATAVTLGVTLVIGWTAWASGLRPPAAAHTNPPGWRGPWQQPAFRRLMAVFVLNGIASAVPATLVLFFVQDRLQAPVAMQPLFLGSYFLAAALAIPLWLRLVPRIGLERTWIAGMFTAIAAFASAAALGVGDGNAFLVICIASGAALGTDLALPAALLAGTIRASGHAGGGEGAYFGWWNFASKLNLALAAGLALPLLALAGYVPGTRDPAALHALAAAYTLLPCALKAAAALLLYSLVRRHGSST
jgi:Na+/melibiose symporter-like transporter